MRRWNMICPFTEKGKKHAPRMIMIRIMVNVYHNGGGKWQRRYGT